MRYEFGKNWSDFVEHNFNEEIIGIAQRHMLAFLKLPDLKGRTVLDIGCGSGLHSLGALRAGASRIFGFDYDPDSVSTSQLLRERAGNPAHWTIVQGSVLDRDFMSKLETADIVYSWGVLHHTGEMWEAIANAAGRMQQDSMFYIALYTTDVFVDPDADYWLRTKQAYNRAGALRRRCMESAYAWRFTILPELKARRNPLKRILAQKETRGMNYWTDVRDWLGGWPMEFSGLAETKAFCQDKLGLELLNINAGEANTEYLFRKRGAQNYWDDVKARLSIEPLTTAFRHVGGNAWGAALPHYADRCDTNEQPRRSRLMLYENDAPVGFAHQPHAHIVAHGGGRYSHWGSELIFSTTDNTSPVANGRRYSVCAEML